MFTLRLAQSRAGDVVRVDALLHRDGSMHGVAGATSFKFQLAAQDSEDLRWYLEDFLEHHAEPAPTLAARIERRLEQLGEELFGAVFHSDASMRRVWELFSPHLGEARIEVITAMDEEGLLPWELIRNPSDKVQIAARAREFVHTPRVEDAPHVIDQASPIRILIVISRPGGADDVPFRSVASRVLKGLGDVAGRTIEVDVLRPPTVDRLAEVLRAARAAGRPYQVLHFDGHGTYDDGRGYVIFENRTFSRSEEKVTGKFLGALLVDNEVPILVLNACRSAHAEAPEAPAPVAGEAAAAFDNAARAFGSFASEAVRVGVSGVVAMRYNVYVPSAAAFVTELYSSLAAGQTLSEAAGRGRRQLLADPLRDVAYGPRPLQDWIVPTVYEASPVRLAVPGDSPPINFDPERRIAAFFVPDLAPEVQKYPDAGFKGRDETVFALDRLFVSESLVLLHSLAGSGKTCAAAEFARWYRWTGGVDGPVLFTSFERYKSLTHILNESIGRVFSETLERQNVRWMKLPDDQKRCHALELMALTPMLWIWDNVESVGGFPRGVRSDWSEGEQRELAGFLREVKTTGPKVLLTSRREELEWLGDLPVRLRLPPMSMRESLQLASAIAEKRARGVARVEDWSPLLRFAQGNPLTITVLVGQVLRSGISSKGQIIAFVDAVRSGETNIADDAEQGREHSLAASLAYGMRRAFTAVEQRRVALLKLFEGVVDERTLVAMGHKRARWRLDEVRGMTHSEGVSLLDRAAEIGLLSAIGDGRYTVHPAVPWFLDQLFHRCYAPPRAARAVRAFAEVMSHLAALVLGQVEMGNRAFMGLLAAEEWNLLRARRIAMENGSWEEAVNAMNALMRLYVETGRREEWRRLLDEMIPGIVDPATEGPLPGRENEWNGLSHVRVALAREERNWAEAERLQALWETWLRQRTEHASRKPPGELTAVERHELLWLSIALHERGGILRQQGSPDCIGPWSEDFELSLRIGDEPRAAVTAYNAGDAYLGIESIRNPTEAERWCSVSLQLRDVRDLTGRGRCFRLLAYVEYARFQDAAKRNAPSTEPSLHLGAAGEWCQKSLNLFPPDALNDLNLSHNMMGIILADLGQVDRALWHLRESLRFEEQLGNVFGAGQTRLNIAHVLSEQGRVSEALEYANAALRNFEALQPRALTESDRARELIRSLADRHPRQSRS